MNIIVCLLGLCVVTVFGRVTPDYFPQCKRADPEIEKCILNAVEDIRPRLKDGIPEVNVPALEPIVLPTLKLDKTAPSMRIKAVIKNMKAYGGSQFKIEKMKIHLNNKYAAELKLSIPRLRVTADYDVKGSQVLVLNIDGKGRLKSNFTGISVVAKGAAKVVERNGVEYLNVDKLITKVKVGHGQVDFDDVERPLAATSAATFFNASPGVVMDILSPLIEETSAAVLKAYLHKIFATIPLKEILLD